MNYLMWDVDGTLLLTGGAGKDALINVIKDYYFLDAFDFTQSLAGRTDSDIVKKVVTRLRGRCNTAEAAGILIRYHSELTKQLPLHRGRVLKNVERTLAYFQQPGSKYLNCLLTGNTRTGAQEKLAYYKLDKYFCFNRSVFGEISEDRQELARIAFSRLYLANNQSLSPRQLIFIGDTPNDALCAQAIGARCLIILDGSSYQRHDFDSCRPWRIIDCLPDDPAQLEAMLDEE
ncbi:HAD hydrolase-like protein [uncultured Phascolarctobacterium sp.]|uniref:HAD family hydrolase n=1 Tax=uncultured Phascolarctobacterium sp. TaxID=512296 RepID=UPI0025EB5D7B|nr:HAD hydrolase-like protein [uncultured Phascolarctobacterium sp.]